MSNTGLGMILPTTGGNASANSSLMFSQMPVYGFSYLHKFPVPFGQVPGAAPTMATYVWERVTGPNNGEDFRILASAYNSDTQGTVRYVDVVNGSDGNAGTIGAPYRTVRKGINASSNGDTLIMRAGRYRERLGSLSKQIWIQPYDGEECWWLGSTSPGRATSASTTNNGYFWTSGAYGWKLSQRMTGTVAVTNATTSVLTLDAGYYMLASHDNALLTKIAGAGNLPAGSFVASRSGESSTFNGQYGTITITTPTTGTAGAITVDVGAASNVKRGFVSSTSDTTNGWDAGLCNTAVGYNEFANEPACVFLDKKKLKQKALNLAASPGAGYYYYDSTTQNYYVGDDPTNASTTLEITQHDYAVVFSGSNTKLRGFGIAHYGTHMNPSQASFAALRMTGASALCEKMTICLNHGYGVSIQGGSSAFQDGTILKNGVNGAHSIGQGFWLLRNRLGYNNDEYLDIGVSSGDHLIGTIGAYKGAGALVGCRTEQNICHDNHCAGLWLDRAPGTMTLTSDATLNEFTKSGHGWLENHRFQFTTIGSLTGMSANTTYYAINVTANTFQIATTAGGTVIDFGGTGSPTITVNQTPDPSGMNDCIVVNNIAYRNDGPNIENELHSRVIVANNLTMYAGREGIKNSSNSAAYLFNNTLYSNGEAGTVQYTGRRWWQGTEGGWASMVFWADARYMFWDNHLSPAAADAGNISNNIIAETNVTGLSSSKLLSIKNQYSGAGQMMDAQDMVEFNDYNCYARITANSPNSFIQWGRASGGNFTYTSLSAFKTAWNISAENYREANGLESNGTQTAAQIFTNVASGNMQIVPSSTFDVNGVVLPVAVESAVYGTTTGTKIVKRGCDLSRLLVSSWA